MNTRKVLFTALAACGLALGSTQASAALPELCAGLNTVGGWAAAGSCLQGDKIWTFTGKSDTLLLTTALLFSSGDPLEHTMAISGFDNSADANDWELKYTISVVDPTLFYINLMSAGVDQTLGTSKLTKDVTGDPSGPFTLTIIDGDENPLFALKTGLNAPSLAIDEKFHVDKDSIMTSISNTYIEKRVTKVPLPGTLALLGLGLVALGASRRFRGGSAV